MKQLRGSHRFNSYKELCAALEITPASRGKQREAQKQDIQKMYRMTVHKNNSILLERITKESRAQEDHRHKVESGQIKVIDGREVDLGSNLLYQDTHIDQLILFRAFGAEDKINTKEGFVISCFDRTKLFKELLKRNGLECAKYSAESLQLAHELIVSRLYAMVNARLTRFEKNGYIRIDRYYLLKGNYEASIEEVQPSVDKALKKMGFKSEFQAYLSKERREQFLELRNDFYHEETGDSILCKRFEIHPLVPIEEACGEDDLVPDLSNKDIQIILTAFFDIFREKALYDIDKLAAARIWKNKTDRTRNEKWQKYQKEVKEIVRTYCAYMNNPLHDEPQAFYSIDELQEYYENLDESITALDYDHIPDYAKYSEDAQREYLDKIKYEQGDQTGDYDEVNENGKDEYDFYALSNMTEEKLDELRSASKAERKSKQEIFAAFADAIGWNDDEPF